MVELDCEEVCVVTVDAPPLGKNTLKPSIQCSFIEGKSNASNAPNEHEFNVSISSIQEMNVLSSDEVEVDEEMIPKHVTETPAFSHEHGVGKHGYVAIQHQYIPVTAVPAVLMHDQTSSTMDAAV